MKKRKRIREMSIDIKIVRNLQRVHGVTSAKAWKMFNLMKLKSNMRYATHINK